MLWCLPILLRLPIDTDTRWLNFTAPVSVRIQPPGVDGVWEYRTDLGVDQIVDDVKRRWDGLEAERFDGEQRWAASLPADRKAECHAHENKPLDSQPKYCQRLFDAGFVPKAEMYPDDEAKVAKQVRRQIPSESSNGWRIVAHALPVIVGPPLAVLALGSALLWVAAGFRRRV